MEIRPEYIIERALGCYMSAQWWHQHHSQYREIQSLSAIMSLIMLNTITLCQQSRSAFSDAISLLLSAAGAVLCLASSRMYKHKQARAYLCGPALCVAASPAAQSF